MIINTDVSLIFDRDPITTKDLIQEEVISYRKNPTSYLQSQIGIR